MTHDNAAGLRDAWIRIASGTRGVDPNKTHYLVRSAVRQTVGRATICGPMWKCGGGKSWGMRIRPQHDRVNIEHDRGAFNGRAEISGTAVDQWGGALEGAVVQLRSVLSAKIRRTNVDADGRFRLETCRRRITSRCLQRLRKCIEASGT